MTRYEEEYYNDIHRIANALEKIAKSLEKTDVSYDKGVEDYLKKVSGEYNSVICPRCYSTNVKTLYVISKSDGSNTFNHYICEDCHKEFDV